MKPSRIADDLEAWTAGRMTIDLGRDVALIERAAKILRASEAMGTALESVEAGIGDRLLAKGPLSKPYATSVTSEVRGALTAFRKATGGEP